ncbi:hypothetical protein ACFUT3_19720 [Streptomyces cinereoruber]|uniref:hypothetical protein n=1 Tax=Streptomyces cinereoruber TaxID=67260 RepID=UPI00363CE68B
MTPTVRRPSSPAAPRPRSGVDSPPGPVRRWLRGLVAVTALTRLSYAGDMITGFLLAACAAVVLRLRGAGA